MILIKCHCHHIPIWWSCYIIIWYQVFYCWAVPFEIIAAPWYWPALQDTAGWEAGCSSPVSAHWGADSNPSIKEKQSTHLPIDYTTDKEDWPYDDARSPLSISLSSTFHKIALYCLLFAGHFDKQGEQNVHKKELLCLHPLPGGAWSRPGKHHQLHEEAWHLPLQDSLGEKSVSLLYVALGEGAK